MRLSLSALSAILFVGFGVLWFVLGFLVHPAGFDPLERAVGSVVYAAVVTAGLGILIALRRRREGGRARVVGVHRALRSGVLPETVDPVAWTRELEATRWRYRNNRIVVPVSAVLATAFAVWAALALSPLWWVFLVLFLGLCGFSGWETRRALRTIEHLLTELRGQ